MLNSVHVIEDTVAASGLVLATLVQQSSTSIAETIIGSAIALSAVVLALTARLRAFAADQKQDRAARKDTDDLHTQTLAAHTRALELLVQQREDDHDDR